MRTGRGSYLSELVPRSAIPIFLSDGTIDVTNPHRLNTIATRPLTCPIPSPMAINATACFNWVTSAPFCHCYHHAMKRLPTCTRPESASLSLLSLRFW